LLSGFSTVGTGRFQQSIDEAKIAIALDPDQTPEYGGLAFDYVFLNRLEEAENVFQRAAGRKLEILDLILAEYYVAFLRGDKAGMDRAAARTMGKAGTEDLMLHSQALALARSDQLEPARAMSQRAVDLAMQAGKRERAAQFKTAVAMWEALYGNASAARRSAKAALELSRGRDVQFGAAFALLRAGESSQARALAGDLAKRFPEDTSVNLNYLPALRGQAPSGSASEFGVPGISFNFFFGALLPAYVLGETYLAAQKGTEAAAEFQKLVDHRGVVLADPVGAMARLQLARALALSGEKGKAKAAYEDVLKIWKDADPDFAMVKQAWAEYAKLSASSNRPGN